MRLDPAAFADLIAGYCLEVQPGQQVLVRSTSLAAPLLLELQRAILERDGWPLLRVEVPGQTRGFYEHARDWQLDDFAPMALHEARKARRASASRPRRTSARSRGWTPSASPARAAPASRSPRRR
jgi:aminopeptidase